MTAASRPRAHQGRYCRTSALALVVAGCVVYGCAGPPPLSNTSPSADALAQAVLDAVERRDRAAAEALALSETEFRDHVWPELDASRPERNLPFSYVWGDLRQKSDNTLTRTLAQFGGQRFTLLRVSFEGDTTRYPGFSVHRETTIHVRDGAGEEQALRLFGSSLEQDGAWKVFSYIVDD